jgi:hypothetical protein
MSIECYSNKLLASVKQALKAGKSEATIKQALREHGADPNLYIKLAKTRDVATDEGADPRLLETPSRFFKRWQRARDGGT